MVLFPVLLCALAFSLFIDYALNKWYADFWNAIQNKEFSLFWDSMKLFSMLAACKILIIAYSSYLRSMVAIRWRTELTRQLQEKWLLGRGFSALHLPKSQQEGTSAPTPDNPDQRLQEDADLFVTSFLSLSFSFIEAVGSIFVFLPVLWKLSPPYAFGVIYMPGWLLYIAVVYALGGSVATHMFGWMLVPLHFLRQSYEANFRHAAVQVRDNAESIALYGSEATEHRRLLGHFDDIQRVVWEQMRYNKHLAFLQYFYFQLGTIFPWLILAPSYFSGAVSLGTLMQITGALGHVKGSLDWFTESYEQLAQVRATVDRLWGFFQAIDAGSKQALHKVVTRETSDTELGAALSAHGICLQLPDGRRLWDKAKLEVQPKERVLLLGPDGCGKSLFLRAIAGCWPATGQVRFGAGGSLFVPQKPFVPKGTLRAAVAYPEMPEAYSDDAIRHALTAVHLAVLEDVPLDEQGDWQKRLSGGEQQRLALAHALLRRPGVLILDEATSAIGEEAAANLYKLLAEELPQTAVISVDHDANAKVGPSHNVHLTYEPQARCWAPN